MHLVADEKNGIFPIYNTMVFSRLALGNATGEREPSYPRLGSSRQITIYLDIGYAWLGPMATGCFYSNYCLV
jgi:hypothetical protein